MKAVKTMIKKSISSVIIVKPVYNMTEDFSLKALVPYAVRLSIKANC